jgi:hypothetical protein
VLAVRAFNVATARRLERFLRQCHPGMLVAVPELYRAMQGYQVADQIMQWMVDVSGSAGQPDRPALSHEAGGLSTG